MIKRHLRSVFFVIGAALLLGSLLTNYVVVNGFLTRPTAPKVETGEVIPYELKGKTFYITQRQKEIATGLFIAELTGFAMLLIYFVLFSGSRR